MSAYTETLIQAAFQAYDTRRFSEAATALRLAVGGGERDGYALYFLGHLAYLDGNLADAADLLSVSLAIDPGNARAHNDLGETFRALGRLEDAAVHLRQAIALQPDLAHAYGNLAATLLSLDQPDEALRVASQGLTHAADKAVALCDYGCALGRMNRPHEAIDQYRQALALQPDNHHARYFKSLLELSLGNMPQAWEWHEARLMLPLGAAGRRKHAQPRWQGETDIAGRTILLHAEQGFGDTIQFVRYAPLVAAMGANVLLEAPPALKELLGTVAGIARVFAFGEPLPPFDLHCSLMSLPFVFRTGPDSIPATIPYVHAPSERQEEWRQRLGPRRQKRIGIAWSGHPTHADNNRRSIRLDQFADVIAAHPELEFHVLQNDLSDAERRLLDDLANVRVPLASFVDTAALVSLMDLVITIDTSFAHLAGALGIPAWVLLCWTPDWRWLRDRPDSPWYPTLRLFRQQQHSDWATVLCDVSAQLAGLAVNGSDR